MVYLKRLDQNNEKIAGNIEREIESLNKKIIQSCMSFLAMAMVGPNNQKNTDLEAHRFRT